MIKEYIADGKIVPMEVTVQLLENAMMDQNKGKGRFLIDGTSNLWTLLSSLHDVTKQPRLITPRLPSQNGPSHPL